MSWVIPSLLNSVLPAKQGNVQRSTVKRPNLGHQHVGRIQGWSLLELISRRPGRRRNENGKATRSSMGTLLLPPLGDPQDLRASLPRAHVLSLQRSHLDLCEPKERRVLECLISVNLSRLKCAREGKAVILKSRVNGSTVLLVRLTFDCPSTPIT